MNDDQRFKKHLDDSHGAVWKVAKYLNRKGHNISIPPTFVAPNHQEWKEYADDGDLYLGQRIEVKKRGFIFSSAKDWPYKTFMVCAKHSFDNAKPKPYAYFILSKDANYAGVVKGSTQKVWTVDTVRDNRYNNMIQDVYTCPLSVVKFISLT